MLRLMMRSLVLCVLALLLVPAGFSKSPEKLAGEDLKKAGESVSSNSLKTAAPSDATKADEAEAVTTPYAPAQNSSTDKTTASVEYKTAPIFTPMLATTGTIGMFTLETGETLPKGGFAFSAFGNKLGRMPGSVTVLEFGFDADYGVTDDLSVYAAFDPYGHVHVGCPGQLSLRSIPTSFTCPPQNFGSTVPNSFFPVVFGAAPGYAEDYPFANDNTDGIGNITLGIKYALASERHGAPVSLAIRNDLIISSRTDVNKLLANGTQASPLSDLVSVALSKQWSNLMTGTFNFGYMFVRAPRDNNDNHLFDMANQVKAGVGILMYPESRIEPMVEYTALIFDSAPGSPADQTFGARDPIDGVWGLRIYPSRHVGIDLGYRYMLNLRNLHDRSGFVIKLGAASFSEKAPSVNHPPTISCSEDKGTVFLESGDTVAVTCTASDLDNDPLTYTWSSTCGKVDGTGSQIRWLSAGAPLGSCTIIAKVDDGRGGFANSSVSVRVDPRRITP